MHDSLEHYEVWKDEEPIRSKTEIHLPKQYKISFLLCFLGYFTISLTILCMKMM